MLVNTICKVWNSQCNTLEPEWEGHVTLEFSNTTPLPAKIYANEGAAQFLFLKGTELCELSYADRYKHVSKRCNTSKTLKWTKLRFMELKN